MEICVRIHFFDLWHEQKLYSTKGQVASSPEIKRLEHGDHNAPPAGAGIKNGWSYTSAPP
jgi:hypothetical protein